tara:strand:- start:1955 stop:2449 length:495 start_codon:yes stop_codon:yes gene_type:complete
MRRSVRAASNPPRLRPRWKEVEIVACKSYAEAVVILDAGLRIDCCCELVSHSRARCADGSFAKPLWIAVVFHGSHIVTYHRDGSYTLDSCGQRTTRIRRKINKFSPGQIRTEKSAPVARWALLTEIDSASFRDGMTVGRDGSLSGFKAARSMESAQLRREAIDY